MPVYMEAKTRSFANCMDASGRVYVFGDVPMDVRLMKRCGTLREIDTGIPEFRAYELTELGKYLAGV